MGIPGFSTWLRERYPEAFNYLPRGSSFDHVYIDLPSTLHGIVRQSRTRTGYHMNLYRRLDELLALLRPQRRVMLALDGPAPLAKLLEQRRRRNREANKLESEGLDKLTGSATAPKSKNTAISPLYLTTGTTFMLEIHSSLMYYICLKLTSKAQQHLQFEFSDSNVKGEGELKILSRLLHDVETQPNESHLVVGADSDLMLMLMIAGERNVALCADVVTSPRNRLKQPSRALVFNRGVLEKTWRTEHLGPDASYSDVTDLALNLTLLAILSHGNDYLPACAGGLSLKSKTHPGLWNLYLDMRRQKEWEGASLVRKVCSGCNSSSKNPKKRQRKSKDGSKNPSHEKRRNCSGNVYIEINKPMLAALLQRHYEQRMAVLENTTEKKPKQSFSTKNWSEKSWKGSWDFGPPEDPDFMSKLDQLPILTTPATHARLSADPETYFQGILWVLSMYSTGKVENYRYTYNGGSVPILQLISFLRDGSIHTAMSRQKSRQNSKKTRNSISSDENSNLEDSETGSMEEEALENQSSSSSSNEPLIPAACALALLPARGRLLAATPLRHLMDADSPIAEIYAVCKECQRLASELRSVGTEFENVRKELANLQAALAGAPLDSEEPAYAEEDLSGAVERCEHAQDRLRKILAELSRSQKEHLLAMHPFKPFPTAELEAAVTAVPKRKYPYRERRLLSFGREMLYSWNGKSAMEDTKSSVYGGVDDKKPIGDGEEVDESLKLSGTPKQGKSKDFLPVSEEEFKELPAWLKDCACFARRHPRLGNPSSVLKLASRRINRKVLPMHPYMTLFDNTTNVRSGQSTTMNMLCQIRFNSTCTSYHGTMDYNPHFRSRAILMAHASDKTSTACLKVQVGLAHKINASKNLVVHSSHSGCFIDKRSIASCWFAKLPSAFAKGAKILRSI